MSANSSFSSESLLDLRFGTISIFTCFMTSPALFIFSTYIVLNILFLLPLCIFILHLGHQHLLKSSPSSAISHTDSFTYHLVIIELIGTFGGAVCLCGNGMENPAVFTVGISLLSLTSYGQVFFHNLTCVERYLAVVHPITYMSLRKERGVKIRNIAIGCAWLLCCVGIVFETVIHNIFVDIFVLTSSTIIISLCSLSVLWVLIHPGPGKRGEGRVKVDQSKQRAFYTIMALMGIMILKLSLGLMWAGLDAAGSSYKCLITACGFWMNIPNSLALPLLFLQRAGKLDCCK